MIAIMIAAGALLAVPAAAQEPQGVEYRIEARLDEATGVLTGRAHMRYTNRAGTPLDTLWFHQHLNAFRPNSAWATRELQFGERRFQDLGPGEHAFERLSRVAVGGQTIAPFYPDAPDSTVVAVPLPAPVRPGESVEVELDWDARLATLPRRQGRSGRHYDFAQWYPRIAAYTGQGWQTQNLLPQGEFFGEFATYDVTLEVAADQVMGATGVPVEGDPGWSDAARPGASVADGQRDFYDVPEAAGLGLLSGAPAPDRKRVRWRAEDVHHFAWSLDPDFVYEGDEIPRGDPGGGTISVHVLYWPGDADWAGVALERTKAAIEWQQEIFGPYPWPQITNLHRLESGGTEFPMVVMDGSPSFGLILHEIAHQYVHGIFANNEFRDGWLDEGFSSYLTDRYLAGNGQPGIWSQTLDAVRRLERQGRTQPIDLPSAEYADPQTYSMMTYAKAELVLRMLEWLIGEEAMREALRIYYRDHALSHVDEADFRAAVEEASGEELGWFFDQWLRTTDQLDYAIARAQTRRRPDGRWETTVDVSRSGDIWMPVTLQVGSASRRLTSRDRLQTVTIETAARPEAAVLDPGDHLLDIEPGNNRRRID